MTPERWHEIREILDAAMQLQPSQRVVYLDHACSSDPSLRREVESLLAANEEARTSFLAEPAPQETSLEQGTKLGPYEIVSAIGAGGMGEVYRAHDPRLGRDVAIKVLRGIFTSDADRLRRFEQEARAAAALNHPNIVAIHDFGTTDQRIPYVVSELLEGETLRERINRGTVPLGKTMDYASQILRGLTAAHDKGIVHRDL
ncbi:MAG TPA: serine/threonine-protein kinase, partial [Terriglobia bacterium]|nr:serine/threonine-protein kinase [Terriglobia bacterium]